MLKIKIKLEMISCKRDLLLFTREIKNISDCNFLFIEVLQCFFLLDIAKRTVDQNVSQFYVKVGSLLICFLLSYIDL